MAGVIIAEPTTPRSPAREAWRTRDEQVIASRASATLAREARAKRTEAEVLQRRLVEDPRAAAAPGGGGDLDAAIAVAEMGIETVRATERARCVVRGVWHERAVSVTTGRRVGPPRRTP